MLSLGDGLSSFRWGGPFAIPAAFGSRVLRTLREPSPRRAASDRDALRPR